MKGAEQVKRALITLRQFIQQTISKIGVIFGQVIFKVFEGEVTSTVVNLQFVLSPANNLAKGRAVLNFCEPMVIPESVQRALEILMCSDFGRIIVDIKRGVVRWISVCSEARFAKGA